MSKLKQLGLFETVLEHDFIPEKLRNQSFAGFPTEIARQSSKEATFCADGESRAAAIVAYLTRRANQVH
jgi:hypothetical protein